MGAEGKGLVYWMDTQDLWNACYSTQYLYLSSNWEIRDFSCRLRRLRIRQREAGKKKHSKLPVTAFKLAYVVMGQALTACPLCPWLDMHLCPHATVPMLAGLTESPVAVTHLNCGHVVTISSFSVSQPGLLFRLLWIW